MPQGPDQGQIMETKEELRQRRRAEEGEKISEELAAPTHPLKRLWFLYGKALREKPLRTKALTAFVMSGLSNAITQIITKRYRFKESFWYGVQCCPPYSHFVYKFIDKMFGEGPENSMYKVIFDQLCWKPVITMYYFLMNGFLNGGTIVKVRANIRAEFWPAMVDTWRVWPAVSYCNQRWVPAHFRSFTLDIVCFFFDMMMSMRVAVDK